MAKYLQSPSDFVRIPVTDINTYPDGSEISSNLPAAYGIPTKQNQACLNCHFRHNNYCSKWVAQIRRQYWCASWKMHNDMKKENTSY